MDKQPILVYRPNLDNMEIEAEQPSDSPIKEIPWDCLEESKRSLVYDYMYNKLDFDGLAKKYNLNNKARAKREFYYCLTRLSEFAKMRELLEEQAIELTEIQKAILNYYYYDNLTLQQIADIFDVSKQNIQQHLKKVIKTFDVKWTVFAKKSGKKVMYNIPEVLNK